MISICEKVRLQQLRKAKYSILASISHIFQKYFVTEPHTYLCNTLCKSHDFRISCIESGHIFQRIQLFSITFQKKTKNQIILFPCRVP